MSQGSESFQVVPFGSQAWPPGLMAPVPGLGPHASLSGHPITPQRARPASLGQAWPVWLEPQTWAPVVQTDCLAALPGEPGPVLVLFQPSGPAPATARGGRWGMFLPFCVEPSRLGLGLQTPADYSQWTRSRSQNTPNRWAEFPGRQRTDNLAGGAGGEEG